MRRAALVMLVSPLVSAVASVVVKRWGSDVHPLSLSAVPMLIAGVVMGAVALLVERDRPLVFDARSVGALLYLAVLGSAVTFTIYYWLLARVERDAGRPDVVPHPDRGRRGRRGRSSTSRSGRGSSPGRRSSSPAS